MSLVLKISFVLSILKSLKLISFSFNNFFNGITFDWIFSSTRESEFISSKRYDPPCKSNPKFTFLSKIILSLFCKFNNEKLKQKKILDKLKWYLFWKN